MLALHSRDLQHLQWYVPLPATLCQSLWESEWEQQSGHESCVTQILQKRNDEMALAVAFAILWLGAGGCPATRQKRFETGGYPAAHGIKYIFGCEEL